MRLNFKDLSSSNSSFKKFYYDFCVEIIYIFVLSSIHIDKVTLKSELILQTLFALIIGIMIILLKD